MAVAVVIIGGVAGVCVDPRSRSAPVRVHHGLADTFVREGGGGRLQLPKCSAGVALQYQIAEIGCALGCERGITMGCVSICAPPPDD